ncbi:MAG: hypothetical protein ACI934_001296 [Pseudohongiellaceae bacterium]|jgi:hypothetical protein
MINNQARRLAAKLVMTITVFTTSLLTNSALLAHHSFSMYDRSVQYVFTGVVDNINPDASHLQINFVPLNDVRNALIRDADGNRVTWSVEMEGAAASAREGISLSNFPQGTVFSVGLTPLRNGEPGGVRFGGLFKCPEGKAPKPEKHCDSVVGAIHYGENELASPTAMWAP